MSSIVRPVQQMLAADRTLSGLGIEVRSAEGGTAVATMTVHPNAANGHGIAHGGLIYALADTAFACAANSQAPGSATASATIVYFSPARVGETLTAEAQTRHTTKRQSLIDVTVRCGDRVIAEYRGRSARLGPVPAETKDPEDGA